ncbi:MAG: SRPBCC domain-containing protein [Saccharospirillaceae bacterium]|nr:SRPBCC domain-containing protein [Pseudomonadales bacterium]NRB81329.1 SRPBCC domain-containing protein [Saccharospirillaceae bacterium]
MSEQKVQNDTNLELNVERIIKASKETLYNAWLNPELFAKFMTPGEGMKNSDSKIDATFGGKFSLNMIAGDDVMLHHGEYFKLKPFDLIQFSWNSPFSEEGSTVTISLTQVDAGTKLKLNHVKFISEESRDNHNSGWMYILKMLETTVT